MPIKNNNKIHPLAFVSNTVRIGNGCIIETHSYIGENVVIGENATIHPRCFIGDNVSIGNNCTFLEGVIIYNGCIIGNNCVIHSKAIIGLTSSALMNSKENITSTTGNVIIEDDVVIEPNKCIGRPAIGSNIVRKK